MLISIVVPTYRRAPLLSKCIIALSQQSFPKEDFEVIVISDGPDDETATVISSLTETTAINIKYLSLPEIRGPAAARNAGWKNAKGKLIAFTDDDCLPDPKWLTHLWQHFESIDVEPLAMSGKIVVPVSEEPTDYEKNTQNLETAEFITANCACSASALEITGGFDETFSMAWREDSELQFKLLEYKVPIEHVPAAVVIHPVRRAPWGISLREQRKTMFNALLYRKYPRLYRNKIQRRPVWTYYLIVLSFILMMTFALNTNTVAALVAGLVWLALTSSFIIKRLSGTSRAHSHIVEMVVTSFAIPFLSVYWRLYGSWKFRTLFF